MLLALCVLGVKRVNKVGDINYRIQVTIRRQSEPVFTSQEYKTENHDDLHDLLASLAEFVTVEVIDDEGRYDN